MGAMIGGSESTLEQVKKRPAPSTAWKPGQSGNPGGRPRVVADIRALAQAEGDACIAALKRVMDDPKSPAAAKVQAAQALLDRGYGRAIQRQELSGPDGAPIQVQQVPDDRPVLDGFLVEFTEQKVVEGSVAKDEGDEC